MRKPVVVPVVLVSFALAVYLSGCSATPQPSVDGAEEIATIAAPLLAEMRAAAGASTSLSALVYMADAADLAPASAAPTRDAKAAFVYDALRTKADASQRDLISYLTRNGVSHRAFHISNMIALYDVSPATVREIAARADVKRVTTNRPRLMKLPPSIELAETPMAVAAPGANIVRTGADRVWSELGVTGQGIVVAGQDTGVDWTHPALKRQYRGWNGTVADHRYSWHDAIHATVHNSKCGANLTVPCDDNGHGTHTLGTVVGDDGQANRVGMAPGAQWIACRNMDAGYGTPASYIECFEFFLAPYPQGGNPRTDGNPALAPHVINNSWGCDTSEGCGGSEILPVLRTLEAAGIMVVASAGNEGPSCATIGSQPATHSAATLSVGAFDHRNDTIARFSSRGPSAFDGVLGPDVSAPGVSIRSSIPGGKYSGSYSGTSMAGPHVVGEVALLWSADPTLRGNIAATVDVIRATSKPKTTTQSCGGVAGSKIPNNTYGYGLIDAYKAVKSRVPALSTQ